MLSTEASLFVLNANLKLFSLIFKILQDEGIHNNFSC